MIFQFNNLFLFLFLQSFLFLVLLSYFLSCFKAFRIDGGESFFQLGNIFLKTVSLRLIFGGFIFQFLDLRAYLGKLLAII